MCLCHQAVQFGTGQRAVMLRGRKGNRRSGVALAMQHRLQWFIHLWAHAKVREMSTPPMPIQAWSALPYLYLYLSRSWWLGISINLDQLRAILLMCLKVLSLFKNATIPNELFMPFLLSCVSIYDIHFVVFLCLLGKKQASEDSAVGSWSTV